MLHDLYTQLLSSFNRIGLNITGVAPGDNWQHILPGCRSVLVIASGGRDLWSAFLAEIKQHPCRFTDETDPLDRFVERYLAAADPHPDTTRRWIRCAATEQEFVDFRVLGLQAGLGWHSKLGLLLHPVYGPWMGLRLACFTTDLIEPAGALATAGPCRDCPAPCISACPAGAVKADSGWDVTVCATYHACSTRCHHTCDAREACPAGQGHMYTGLQRHYHSHRPSGRQRIAARLGLQSDDKGVGPNWDRFSITG